MVKSNNFLWFCLFGVGYYIKTIALTPACRRQGRCYNTDLKYNCYNLSGLCPWNDLPETFCCSVAYNCRLFVYTVYNVEYPILNNQCFNQLQIDEVLLVLHWVLIIEYYTTIIALTPACRRQGRCYNTDLKYNRYNLRGLCPGMIYQNLFAALFSYNCRLFVYTVYNVEYPILNNQCFNQLQIDEVLLVLHWVLIIEYYTTMIALTPAWTGRDDAIIPI